MKGGRVKKSVQLPEQAPSSKVKLAAGVGVLGALGVASCCLIPSLLLALGLSGAWITGLIALNPYKPILVITTVGLLGYCYYRLYWTSQAAHVSEGVCGCSPLNRAAKLGLWGATVLVLVALAFDYLEQV
jgi:mercuric ion transport protein